MVLLPYIIRFPRQKILVANHVIGLGGHEMDVVLSVYDTDRPQQASTRLSSQEEQEANLTKKYLCSTLYDWQACTEYISVL